MKAPAHTSGWYLQSADSQPLVCFYMQLQPKSRHVSAEQQHVPSVHRWPFFMSDASIHLCRSSSRRLFSSLKMLPDYCLNTRPLRDLFDQIEESHDGKPKLGRKLYIIEHDRTCTRHKLLLWGSHPLTFLLEYTWSGCQTDNLRFGLWKITMGILHK